jgi:3-hydroxyisobutyrate dehydrogenase-like beta-hydroxyacid dehydrogenase
MRIAVLGLGRMGQAVAGRIIDCGHELVVWNRTPGKATELVARGARQADSVASAVSDVDVAMTSLANDDVVRQVACGDNGIRSSIGDDAVYADLSTISPGLSAELDHAFPRFAAVPILGSPVAVAAGQAVYLLGAAPPVTKALEPVVLCLSDKVRRYDSPPLASTAKLAVNLLLLDGLVALAESVTVGRSGGLSDDQLRELLGDSPMVAPGLKNRFEGVLTGSQDPWWTTVLGAKDAGLAVGVVVGHGGQLALTDTARQLYLKAASLGFADADIAAVANLYRQDK